MNCALRGMAADAIAAQPKSPKGQTRTRADAKALIEQAKRDVLEMEMAAARRAKVA